MKLTSAGSCLLLLLAGSLACFYDEGGTAEPLAGSSGGSGPSATPPRKPDAAVNVERPAVDAAPDVTLVPPLAPEDAASEAPLSLDASSDVPPPGAEVMPPPPMPPATPVDGSACPDTPNLAVCLRFESSLADESPHRLPVESRRVRFVPGMHGLALDLREDERIALPSSPVMDAPNISLEADVNPHELGRRMGVVEKPGQYGLFILASGSAMCSGAGGYALRSNAITAGRWTRVQCTFDATSIVLYVDGQRAAVGPAGPVATDRPGGLRIGWEDEPGRAFNGLIDNVRVWRVLRTF